MSLHSIEDERVFRAVLLLMRLRLSIISAVDWGMHPHTMLIIRDREQRWYHERIVDMYLLPSGERLN